MTTATYKAGQEIDAYCTKCRMDLGHRIVAVAQGKPVKAECLTCRGVHMYRAPKSAPKAAPAASNSSAYLARTGASPAAARSASSSSGGSSRAAKSVAKPPPVDDGPLVPPDSAHVFIYKTSEKYAPLTWISHKTFGIGRVERELGPNKIEVRFDGGARVLVHDMAPGI